MFSTTTFLLILTLWGANARNLQLSSANAKLPSGLSHMPTVYDGDNSIYLLGGYTALASQWRRHILKYSIAEDTIENVGEMGTALELGNAVWGGSEHGIFHFGGTSNPNRSSQIFNFHPDEPNNWTPVGNLLAAVNQVLNVWDGEDSVYVIGGQGNSGGLDTITKFSVTSHTTQIVGFMPSGRYWSSAVWDNLEKVGYIFGGHSSGTNLKDILKFDSTEGTVKKLDVELSANSISACGLWIRNETYVIGGYPMQGSPPPITRFNPAANEVVDVQVDGFPDRLSAQGCVFVEKLNRIYIFGGVFEAGWRNEINFIDI